MNVDDLTFAQRMVVEEMTDEFENTVLNLSRCASQTRNYLRAGGWPPSVWAINAHYAARRIHIFATSWKKMVGRFSLREMFPVLSPEEMTLVRAALRYGIVDESGIPLLVESGRFLSAIRRYAKIVEQDCSPHPFDDMLAPMDHFEVN